MSRKRKAEYIEYDKNIENIENKMMKEERIISELMKNHEISSIITKSLKKDSIEKKKEALLQYIEKNGKVPKQKEEYIGRFYRNIKHGQNSHLLEELMRNPIIRSDIERLRRRKIEKENERKYIRNIPSPEKRKLARKTYRELKTIATTYNISYKHKRKHIPKKELLNILLVKVKG